MKLCQRLAHQSSPTMCVRKPVIHFYLDGERQLSSCLVRRRCSYLEVYVFVLKQTRSSRASKQADELLRWPPCGLMEAVKPCRPLQHAKFLKTVTWKNQEERKRTKKGHNNNDDDGDDAIQQASD